MIIIWEWVINLTVVLIVNLRKVHFQRKIVKRRWLRRNIRGRGIVGSHQLRIIIELWWKFHPMSSRNHRLLLSQRKKKQGRGIFICICWRHPLSYWMLILDLSSRLRIGCTLCPSKALISIPRAKLPFFKMRGTAHWMLTIKTKRARSTWWLGVRELSTGEWGK